MIPSDLKLRFDELSAGRAMGDLSMEEEHELILLGEQFEIVPDPEFDLLVSALGVEPLGHTNEILPASLALRLHQCADEMISRDDHLISKKPAPGWQKILKHPLPGWAAAAAIALIALVNRDSGEVSPRSNVQTESQLREQAPDLIELKFQGAGKFTQASGKVIWSDQLQKGYMILSGLPINDSKKLQYQLWIVDPKRDEAPVDGGVFDISADQSTVLVPIDAKLSLTKPQAFVITLEQPGGVVKSKQEQVVALAKN